MSVSELQNRRWNVTRDAAALIADALIAEALIADALIADERGSTAIEYALIAASIGVAIAASVVVVGSDVNALFASVSGIF